VAELCVVLKCCAKGSQELRDWKYVIERKVRAMAKSISLQKKRRVKMRKPGLEKGEHS